MFNHIDHIIIFGYTGFASCFILGLCVPVAAERLIMSSDKPTSEGAGALPRGLLGRRGTPVGKDTRFV